MEAQVFSPGFRLSRPDAAVLAVGAIGAAGAAKVEPWLGVAVVFAIGHLFLFCNVFRIERRPELVWAALFLVLAAGTSVLGAPGWFATFLLSSLGTCVLVAREMQKPSYHGVLWRRINPDLPQWWSTQDRARAKRDV